jgi:hypothetical protein
MTTRKPPTIKDVIRYLVLMNPDLSNEEIQLRLDWLDLPPCTLFLIAQIRAGFRDDVRFLERIGMLRNKRPLIPSRLRKLKPPKPKPVKEFYYRWD